jgi:hypothetical protein
VVPERKGFMHSTSIKIGLEPAFETINFCTGYIDFKAFVIDDVQALELWVSNSEKGEDWYGIPFHFQKNIPSINVKQQVSVYTARITKPKSSVVQYTLKFKKAGGEYEWAGEQGKNGYVYFTDRDLTNGTVFFDGEYRDALSTTQVKSDVQGVSVWELSRDVPADFDKPTRLVLGKPCGMVQFNALVRPWEPWLEPRVGFAPLDLDDKDAMCLTWQKSDSTIVTVLALSGINDCITAYNERLWKAGKTRGSAHHCRR